MGYLTALHARLGAKIGDLHAKDSNSFRNRLIYAGFADPNFRLQQRALKKFS